MDKKRRSYWCPRCGEYAYIDAISPRKRVARCSLREGLCDWEGWKWTAKSKYSMEPPEDSGLIDLDKDPFRVSEVRCMYWNRVEREKLKKEIEQTRVPLPYISFEQSLINHIRKMKYN